VRVSLLFPPLHSTGARARAETLNNLLRSPRQRARLPFPHSLLSHTLPHTLAPHVNASFEVMACDVKAMRGDGLTASMCRRARCVLTAPPLKSYLRSITLLWAGRELTLRLSALGVSNGILTRKLLFRPCEMLEIDDLQDSTGSATTNTRQTTDSSLWTSLHSLPEWRSARLALRHSGGRPRALKDEPSPQSNPNVQLTSTRPPPLSPAASASTGRGLVTTQAASCRRS
jgi:hypothetical protein